MEKVFPEFATVGNPLDLTAQGSYDTHIIDESLHALATSGAYDVIVWARGFPARLDMRSAVGKALTSASDAAPDVVFTLMSLVGGHFHDALDAKTVMLEPKSDFEGMPFLQGLATGMRGLNALCRLGRVPAGPKAPQSPIRSARQAQRELRDAVRILREAKRPTLTEREGKRLLALYGIPVTPEALATSAEDAARVASNLGFPVAMKVESADIVHKTDIGGVCLNIGSPEEAASAFEKIVAACQLKRPEAEIAGRRGPGDGGAGHRGHARRHV